MGRDWRHVIEALERKANDRACPPPERDALLARAHMLREKHDIPKVAEPAVVYADQEPVADVFRRAPGSPFSPRGVWRVWVTFDGNGNATSSGTTNTTGNFEWRSNG